MTAPPAAMPRTGPIVAPADCAVPRPCGQVTIRQVEILRLTIEGLPDWRIAQRFRVSVRTVSNEMGHAMKVFKAKNRYQLIAMAMRQGVIE